MSKIKATLEPKNHIQVQVISGGIPGKSLTYDDLTPEDKADLLQDTYDKEASDTRFAPKQHTHEISDVNGLSDELESSGLTLVNLIENGDFSQGLNGWVSKGTISNGNLILITSQVLRKDIEVVGENKFYSLIKTETTDYVSGGKHLTFRNYNTSEGTVIIETIESNQPLNVKTFLFEKTGGFRAYITGTINGNLIIHYWIVINLTDIFGAGIEPTKEEMDLLIETLGVDYFEEITVTKLQSINWLLKLIRQNALATTSLGGTIL